MIRLKTLVLAGPEPAKHGVMRWRCTDLQRVIREEFEVEIHERTVDKLLHNPKRDLDAQELFKKLADIVAAILLAHAFGKPLHAGLRGGVASRAQMTLSKLEAAIGWVERNRLSEQYVPIPISYDRAGRLAVL